MRIRIIPLIIFTAFISVFIKISDIFVDDIQHLEEAILLSTLDASAAEETKSDTAAEGDAAATPSEDAKPAGEEAKTDENKPAGEEAKTEEKAIVDKGEPSPGYKGGPKEVSISDMTLMEKNILENLAKRRQELDDWNNSIEMKANILDATEKKINGKMTELESLKADVEKLLTEYNEKENAKIAQLVKIYENMKPKDAAKIFEEMDMPILLEVVGKMKEQKSAKILANITPEKAKELSVELANQRRLEEEK